MRVLLDTHVLLWVAEDPDLIPAQTRQMLEDSANDLVFSVVSIWEIAIKSGLRRPGFDIRPLSVRNGLVANGLQELLISSEHAAGVARLPDIHRDPFDRLLLSQAISEGATLLTADRVMLRYGQPTLAV
jgi:PIN domain nuclease of toxin-antitoxin system